MSTFPQPPLNDASNRLSRPWHLWHDRLSKFLSDTAGLIPWTSISKAGSNLTELTTRNHADLQNINTATYTHLSAVNHTDLTDSGDTALHFHSSDRARANHTGTQLRATISDFAHDHTTADGSGVLTNDEHDGFIELATSAVPSTPAAGKMRLYAQDAAGVARLRAVHSTGSDLAFFRDAVTRVRNNSGTSVAVGEAVYVTGSTGNFPTIAKARADATATMPAFGLVIAAAADNAFTTVQLNGIVSGFDTSAFAEGAIVYISSTTAGALTTTRPSHPNIAQPVGVVIKSNAGAGQVQVFVSPSYEGGESGSNRATFTIGTGAGAGAVEVAFSNANIGALQWTPTASRTLTLPDVTGTLATQAYAAARANHTGTQTLSTISDVTITAANLNALDDGVNTALHFHDSDRARANHTGTQTMSTISDLPTLASGTYTPTLTNVANIDSSTAFKCQYSRVGNIVTVSGAASVNATTAATSTSLGISLPIASNLGATDDCNGAAAAGSVQGQSGTIRADTANNRAELFYVCAVDTDVGMRFTFSYEII